MWDRINFYPNQMKSLPIPIPDQQTLAELDRLIRQVRVAESSNDLAEAQSLAVKIDDMVFNLFELSEQEKSKVRGWYLELLESSKQKTEL